jgi:DNA-binding response OmpR family regulator
VPTKEDIADQQRLLLTHRRTLTHYLDQAAKMGPVNVPPNIAHSIGEVRENIRYIKETLRKWGVAAEDYPDDQAQNGSPASPLLANARQKMDIQGEKILLIEDTEAHAQNIKDRLEWLGCVIEISYSGEAGLNVVKDHQPDLIILDIMLETDDKGFDVIRKLQADSTTRDIPIVVYSITAKEIENRLRGIALGALWYLDKSAGITELEAIVRRALEFRHRLHRDAPPAHLVPLDFDSRTGVVWIDGNATEIKLPALQADLLAFLVERPGQICERDQIANHVYKVSESDSVSNESIDRLVSRLRALLGDNPRNPRLVESVRGKGYRLIVDQMR